MIMTFVKSARVIREVDPIMKNLNETYVHGATDFLDYSLMTEKVKYSIYILFVAFVFLFLWTPYLNRLNQDIWRTKGMLNMIPLRMMSRNENLKAAFSSNNILLAVK